MQPLAVVGGQAAWPMQSAAIDWRQQAVKAHAFSGANLKQFQQFSNGLTLPDPPKAD